ncbi:ubiquitin-like modifier-activating enzyme 1, partial [Oscarella lobularis]|uniref:ubiquitin-like modifier-activating enzyme 1 n=1 Tax=Oscarella lobularis TaxID=121494 RepID=UPI00331359F7
MTEAREIDEGLYSRQLYVLGHDAMRRMGASNVLISGMRGLGVEIAKNVILSGVKSVTIHDTGNVAIADLSSQFFLKKDDIGKNRAAVSLPRLAELNTYVPLTSHTETLTEDFVAKFQVVVLATSSLEEQCRLGDFAHRNGIHLIVAESFGLFGHIFCDFGEKFVVSDPTGEQPIVSLVTHVTQDKVGVVTCPDDSRHGFSTGDFVTFSEVQGMTELNDCTPMEVKPLGPYSFSIGDTSSFSSYQKGGVAVQVKQPLTVNFKSLKDSLDEPEYVISDFAKMDRMSQLHVAFQALHHFQATSGALPKPRNKEDYASFLATVKEFNSSSKAKVETLDEKLLETFSFNATGD